MNEVFHGSLNTIEPKWNLFFYFFVEVNGKILPYYCQRKMLYMHPKGIQIPELKFLVKMTHWGTHLHTIITRMENSYTFTETKKKYFFHGEVT